MCCLFGLIDSRNQFGAKEKSRILSVLATECEERGTDATGIAYCSHRHLSMEAEVKSSIAAIEDSLKAEMLAKNTDVLSGKDYLITWKTIITNRFDSAAFKLTHADLFNQFSRSTTTRRFVIA